MKVVNLLELKPGDEIAVVSHGHHGSTSIRTVRRVMKRWVEDSKGERWDARGHRVPREYGYWRSDAAPATDEHREAVRRQHVVSGIEVVSMRDITARAPTEVLEALLAALKVAEAATPPKATP